MKKILIIEDDFRFKSLLMGRLHQLFTDNDLKFYFTENEAEAKEEINKENYDLITLDGFLDYGHGHKVLSSMSPQQLAITVVVSDDEHFLIEAQKIGIRTSSKNNIFETLVL